MWTRQDLKYKAKIAFKANYWKSVLVAFLATILAGAATTSQSKRNAENIANGVDPSLWQVLAISGIVIFLIIVVILIDIFLVNPLRVGCNNFFLCNRRNSNTDLYALEIGFKSNYKNNVIVMFMTQLFIALWSLLFVIPGIYKHYQYYLVEFILAENPSIDYHEAMETSKRLMEGSKMNTLVMELSFIGWYLLGCLTFGLVNLFYTNPYYEATKAELYIALAHPAESDVIEATPKEEKAQTVDFTVEKN
ncbi:MAG: DUF975 family protein [Clostridiales bacterium]|nr:DUF975 family protein [Candidatus Crickella equi]